jgi:hypothetical protein
MTQMNADTKITKLTASAFRNRVTSVDAEVQPRFIHVYLGDLRIKPVSGLLVSVKICEICGESLCLCLSSATICVICG